MLMLLGFATAAPAATMRVAQFRNSVGVNTHLNYTDGRYVKWDRVILALRYLGIYHLRDSAPRFGAQGQEALAILAQVGYKYDFVLGGPPADDATVALLSFYARFPTSVVAVEGPNEVDLNPLTFGSLRDSREGGYPATIAYMSAVRRLLKANTIGKIRLIAPSYIGPIKIAEPTDVDAGNLHDYPWASESRLPYIQANIDAQRKLIGQKPVYVTEFGYNDLKTTPLLKAQNTLKWLVANIRYGVTRSYLYELLDAYPDPTNTDLGIHWGLFDQQFSPKPVAVAIHNLMGIVGADDGKVKTALPVNMDGPVGLDSLTLTRGDNHNLILLWRDGTATSETNLRFTAPVNFRIYNPRTNAEPIRSGNAATINVALGADLLIAEVWQ